MPSLPLLLSPWVRFIICIYSISHITRTLKMCILHIFHVVCVRKFNLKWVKIKCIKHGMCFSLAIAHTGCLSSAVHRVVIAARHTTKLLCHLVESVCNNPNFLGVNGILLSLTTLNDCIISAHILQKKRGIYYAVENVTRAIDQGVL